MKEEFSSYVYDIAARRGWLHERHIDPKELRKVQLSMAREIEIIFPGVLSQLENDLHDHIMKAVFAGDEDTLEMLGKYYCDGVKSLYDHAYFKIDFPHDVKIKLIDFLNAVEISGDIPVETQEAFRCTVISKIFKSAMQHEKDSLHPLFNWKDYIPLRRCIMKYAFNKKRDEINFLDILKPSVQQRQEKAIKLYQNLVKSFDSCKQCAKEVIRHYWRRE